MTTIKGSQDLAARLAIAARVEEILRRSGALGDLARPVPFDPRALRKDPDATAELAVLLAGRLRGADRSLTVDVVAAVRQDAGPLAVEIARDLGVVVAFRGRDPVSVARRRVVLVDLSLFSGAALASAVAAVEGAGGEVVECLVVVDRSEGVAAVTSPASGRVYPVQVLLRVPTAAPGE